MPYSIHIPLWVDLIAVFVGASQGTSLAMTEQRRPLAPTGALVLAATTGLGGAILRDLVLNVRPAVFGNNWYLGTVAVAFMLTWAIGHAVHDTRRFVALLDAATLGVYACAGALKAEDAGLSMLSELFVATIAATGGSVIRDILLARVPLIMVPGELYFVPAVASGAAFLLLGLMTPRPGIRFLLASALGFGLRMVALWRGWEMGAIRSPLKKGRGRAP
jgi:uncharacterized membrane protein YeiH